MFRIAVCDDDTLQTDLMREYFEIYSGRFPEKAEVSYFNSGAALLENSKEKSFDIYFLDLIMPEINGMEVATTLRGSGDKGKIIFLTASKDYVFDAFAVKASDYLLKPISPEKLFEKVNSLIEEINDEKPPTVTIKTIKGEQVVAIRDILYIENIDRSPFFHLSDGSVIMGLSKRDRFANVIAVYLESGFSLCNVSVAVNLANVTSMKKDSGTIFLADGQELFCSRSFIKDFKAALDNYRTHS